MLSLFGNPFCGFLQRSSFYLLGIKEMAPNKPPSRNGSPDPSQELEAALAEAPRDRCAKLPKTSQHEKEGSKNVNRLQTSWFCETPELAAPNLIAIELLLSGSYL